MKPEELAAYDDYPRLIVLLAQWADQITAAPLAGMAVANERLVVTGVHVAGGVVTPLAAPTLAAHTKLIKAAQDFQAAMAEIVAGGTG